MQNEIGGRQAGLIAAAAVGLTAGLGTMAFSLGVLMPHLIAAKGWSRGDISFALVCLTSGIFTAGPLAGRLSDRIGAATTSAISLVGFAAVLLTMTATLRSVEMLWAFYFAIALVGAGSTPVVLLRPIAASFDRQRGLAIGLALTGAGIAGFWLPLVIQPMAAAYGWQGGYWAIAAVALIAAPIGWLGIRGFDGVAARPGAATARTGLTLSEAVRTRRFWLLALAGTTMALGVSGLVVHLIPLLLDRGVAAANAAGIASLIGLASVAGRLSVGYLLDRVPAGFVTCGVLGLSALGVMALLLVGPAAAPLAAILLGFAAGSEVDLIAYLCARYFGQRAYGAIYGWQYSIFVIGYGLSPFLVGRMRDNLGSYDAAILLCVAAMLAGALLIAGLARRGGAGESFARAAREAAVAPQGLT